MSYDGFISYSHAADDLLAPRLQAGLQRFAKPWWKRRAVRIFRDESSLSANPHLWSSITEALDTSGWFVLLLSPDAARSEWVNHEITYWVENRDPKKILPVVTDGEFGWTDGDVTGDAVPEALDGVFAEEPRWVDVRWAKGEEQLDLQDPRFADAVADIASTIRGIPKDDLASEEVRQHRRTVRTAWAAGVALLALSIVAIGASIQSARNANEAERLAEAESEARVEADRNAQAADENAKEAEANAAQALVNAQIAKTRELSAASIGLLDTDPELAVLLGLEAIRSAPDADSPPPAARIALRQAVQSSFLLARYPIDEVDGEILFGDLSPAGNAAVLAESRTARVVDLSDGSVRWTASLADLIAPGNTAATACAGEVYFSRDGSRVFVGLIDAAAGNCDAEVPDEHVPRSGVAVFDAFSGRRLSVQWLSECGDQILGSMSPVDPVLPVVMPADGNCDPDTPLDWTITLLDSESFELLRSIPIPDIGMTTWSTDGRRISIGSIFGLGPVVFDALTGDIVTEIPEGEFLGFLSPDGSKIATSDLRSTVLVFDVESGGILDRLPDLLDSPFDIRWSQDGQRLFATGRGPKTAVWDASSGGVEVLLPKTGPGSVVLFDDATERLVHVGEDSVSVWDVSGSVEGARNTGQVDGLIQANSVSGVSGAASVGAFHFLSDEWYVGTFDTATGVLGTAVKPGWMARRTAVLDDGRIVVFERDGRGDDLVLGPLVAWDPATDEVTEILGCSARLSELEGIGISGYSGPCLDGTGEFYHVDRALLSADRSNLVVNSRQGELLFFDPQTLELIETTVLPDGAETIREVGTDWLATLNSPTGVNTPLRAISLWSLPEMELLATLPGSWAQSSPLGDTVAIDEGPGHVSILDTSTGEKVMELFGGSARIRGLAFSPDGTLLMTSATDGFMRIWDVSSGVEIERIPLGDGLDGSGDGYWIDADTVAMGLGDGRWTSIDIGLDSLLELARSRILRTLTQVECDEYGIDPCPTLEQLRGG